MVASQQGYSTFISNFEGEQQQEGLNAVSSSVYIIAHENVVSVRWEATNFKQFEQVIKLAMDISTNRDGPADLDYIAFLLEDFFRQIAYLLNLAFLYLFALLQARDDLIQFLSL